MIIVILGTITATTSTITTGSVVTNLRPVIYGIADRTTFCFFFPDWVSPSASLDDTEISAEDF